MHSTRILLILTGLVELATGLALLFMPSLVIGLLLGSRDVHVETEAVGRVCGAALVAIGLACWWARSDRGSSTQQGVLRAVLVYNVGVTTVLGYAGLTMEPIGGALWPVVMLHASLAVWCVACIGPTRE